MIVDFGDFGTIPRIKQSRTELTDARFHSITTRDTTPVSPGTLINISEAAQMLGVSESALRLWTDEGRIKAFVTPGGHRRYDVADLKRFLSARPRAAGVRDLVGELEEATQSLRDVARTALQGRLWYTQLDPDSQQQLAGLGRGLLQAIIRYAGSPARRDEGLEAARSTGSRFGETLEGLGLPLTDAVEVFVLHRDPIMKAAAGLIKRREHITGRAVDAIPLVAHVMDEALLALVAAYQRNRSNGASTENYH